jgi:hypothetical protein
LNNPRPAPRGDEDQIEADQMLAVGPIARNPDFGCAAHALALGGAECGIGFLLCDVGSVFDFDEGEAFAPHGNEVDLAG